MGKILILFKNSKNSFPIEIKILTKNDLTAVSEMIIFIVGFFM